MMWLIMTKLSVLKLLECYQWPDSSVGRALGFTLEQIRRVFEDNLGIIFSISP